jgi:amino acid adenylation domain-containing protein
MRVEQFLKESARRFGEKTALITGGERFTYSELDLAAERLAAALSRRGVERGNRVVIFMNNSWQAVVAIFGVLKAGAVLVTINPSTKADKLAYILNNCRARVLITQEHLARAAADALTSSPSVELTIMAGDAETGSGTLRFSDALDEESDDVSTVARIDLDLAMLIYTSGSTGFPKGVVMTHQSVVTAATSITDYLKSTADDVVLSVLPLSFDYGLYQIIMTFKVGGTLVLEKSFAYPQALFEKLAAERVTGLPLVPTMAAIIVQMREFRSASLPDLRYITNTAAALPPAHIARLQELFPRTSIYSMYGLTECKRCTYLPPEELSRRPESVGIAIPGTEAYVVDEHGERVGPNEIGELVIRGAHVMKGYWEDEVATSKALRPGPYPWEKVLYTGDLFRTDSDGFLYFVSRKDDIIKTRGEKVSPKEVENVLYALEGVQEAAVIGIPDPILGQAIKAFVVIRPNVFVSVREVMQHCTKHLEDHMVPRIVEFRERLPKTESGKINRRLVLVEDTQ